MTKTVRFYDLRILKANDESDPVQPGFWPTLGKRITDKTATAREVSVSGRLVSGEYRSVKQPAVSFFHIGRVRDRSDWPDEYVRGEGAVGALQPARSNTDLFEPTYVVPFGTGNTVAVLSMSMSAPRVRPLEQWFTKVAGFDPGTQEVMLDPILTRRVQDRLAEADGARKLTVKIDAGAGIPESGGGTVGATAREMQKVSTELTFEMSWSLETRKGHDDTTGELLRGARWVAAEADWVRNAEVTLRLPGDGDDDRHTETYNLIKDRFTSAVVIPGPAHVHPSDESVLAGIQTAIDHFGREFRR